MEDEVVIKGSNDLRMNFSYTDDEVKTSGFRVVFTGGFWVVFKGGFRVLGVPSPRRGEGGVISGRG